MTRPRTLREAAPRLLEGLEDELKARPNAILVAGRAERDPRLPAALAAFAERAGFPLLAEPLSGARRGPAAIAHYDALLRDEAWPHVPDLVLRVGDLPTSKPLRTWLAGLDALQMSFDPESAWQDPAGAVGTIVGADPRTTLDALAKKLPRKRKDTSWLDAWHAADRAAARAIAADRRPGGPERAARGRRARHAAAARGDARRRLLDARARRRDVLPGARDAVPGALQPRRERDRRDRLDRVRRQRGQRRADRAAARRRRARARRRRPARRRHGSA